MINAPVITVVDTYGDGTMYAVKLDEVIIWAGNSEDHSDVHHEADRLAINLRNWFMLQAESVRYSYVDDDKGTKYRPEAIQNGPGRVEVTGVRNSSVVIDSTGRGNTIISNGIVVLDDNPGSTITINGKTY